MERLDKLLAATGKWSRKEAKALIKAGRVRVEDRLPKGPEDKVEEGSLVTVDGRPIFTEKYVYLMLHKPAGVISATQDAKEKTVLDLLPKDLRRKDLFPVGRLDKDTEGLLLLTNDGALAHALLAPGRHVDKVYYTKVDGELEEDDVAAFAEGITLGDGTVCLPAGLDLISEREALVTLREVPPGQADAGLPRQAGGLSQAAGDGKAQAGPRAARRGLAAVDAGRAGGPGALKGKCSAFSTNIL